MADKKKEADRDRAVAIHAMRDFVNTVGGKLWIKNLAKYNCFIVDDTFTGNSGSFHNDGKRAVGLTILRDVHQANPDAYAEIMKDIMK